MWASSSKKAVTICCILCLLLPGPRVKSIDCQLCVEVPCRAKGRGYTPHPKTGEGKLLPRRQEADFLPGYLLSYTLYTQDVQASDYHRGTCAFKTVSAAVPVLAEGSGAAFPWGQVRWHLSSEVTQDNACFPWSPQSCKHGINVTLLKMLTNLIFSAQLLYYEGYYVLCSYHQNVF